MNSVLEVIDFYFMMKNIDFVAPDIILVRPQMAENIGAVARAMKNFNFQNLALVTPRDGKPNERAYALCSGASDILDNATLQDTVQVAISTSHFVMATTARNRDLNKPAYTLQQAMTVILEKQMAGQTCSILFGPERTGLENDDLLLADALIHVPVNLEFASLNLAQCVLLVAYEYFQQKNAGQLSYESTEPAATKQDIDYMLKHLVTELESAGFFYPEAKRPSTITLISNIFTRAGLTQQEVRTLRGVIKALSAND